ncbi:MAG: AgmX/PglI C-terminal domain-containing protein [Polyangiales bacterium]|nr:energy transducer TonB [Sandaracinaceae bacterium]
MPATRPSPSSPRGESLPHPTIGDAPSIAIPEDDAPRRVCAHVAYAVGERVLQSMRVPAGATLRVGSSELNELVLCDAQLGETHTLLAEGAEGWQLHIPRGLSARARLGGQHGSLPEHLAAGRAREDGDHLLVPLATRAPGDARRAHAWPSVVLELGTGRLLIALEERSIARVAPLPRALQASVRQQVDYRFAGTLTAVMLVFFGLGLAAESADPLLDTTPPASVLAFRPLYTEPLPPVPELPTEPTTSTELADGTDTRPRNPRPGPTRDATSDRSPRGNGDAPRMTAEEARTQTQELLGSIGSLGLEDRLRGGAVVSSRSLMDDVREGTPGTGPRPGALQAREGRDTSGDPLGSLDPVGTTRAVTEGGPLTERTPPRVRLTPTGPRPGPHMPQDPVTRAMRGRIAAIRRCYERTLVSNPAARGRVVVSFRVETSGVFSGVSVTENGTGDAGLATCMTEIIRNVRVYPGPEGGAATFRYPFVFEPG